MIKLKLTVQKTLNDEGRASGVLQLFKIFDRF